MSQETEEGADRAAQAGELAHGVMIRLELLNRASDHDGASYEQYRTAALVHDAGSISIGKLSHLLRSAQSTTSEMVARMMRAGLLSKARTSHDGRVVLVELTDKGRQLVRQRRKRVRAAYMVLLDKLDRAERVAFADALGALNGILGKADEAETLTPPRGRG
jgi:MarR family transcriptional regulator, organic hydroperoxide resistance regulator